MDFHDSDRSSSLLFGLNELRLNNQQCDIYLKVPDSDEIPAHKNVLAASSPYFSIMFNGSFDDSEKQVITLKDIDFESLKLIIEYLYTGCLRIARENVDFLLITSSFLQISWIQDKCCEFLEKSLDVINCLDIKKFADKHSCGKLSEDAVNYIIKNFTSVSKSEEFLRIIVEELCEILSNNQLYDNSEDCIYSAIVKWVEYKSVDRLEHLAKLLTFIHPSLVSKEFVKKSEIVMNDENCREWTNKVLEKIGGHQQNIFILDKIGNSSNLSKFVLETNKTYQLEPLPEKAFAVSFVGFKNFLYVLGGQSHPKKSRDTSFYYNIYRDRWLSLPPLIRPRSHHRSCILNENLYSIGGCGLSGGPMLSVECLDLLTGKVMEVQGMLDERKSMAAVSHENCLYVMGGEGDHQCIYSMERYDHRVGSWVELASMNQVNSYCSSAVIDNKIYCTEGLGDYLEKYDFRMDKWEIVELQQEREFYELFSMENKLYSISGDEISQYYSEENDWQIILKFEDTHEWDTAVSLNMQIL